MKTTAKKIKSMNLMTRNKKGGQAYKVESQNI